MDSIDNLLVEPLADAGTAKAVVNGYQFWFGWMNASV